MDTAGLHRKKDGPDSDTAVLVPSTATPPKKSFAPSTWAAIAVGAVVAGALLLQTGQAVSRLRVESQCRETWSLLPPVHGIGGRPNPFTSSSSVEEQIQSATGGRLTPGAKGVCLFHGQEPHYQDRGIFTRMGGQVDDACCLNLPLVGVSPYLSVSQVCPCTAPADPLAFDRSFLEIGALDGQFLSNLLFFESQMGWRGLCVEGSPQSYPYLVKNRPHCSTVNGVIGNEGGNKTFLTFSPKGVDSWERSMSCMLGSSVCSDMESAQAYAAQTGTTVVAHTVPMLRLADLFAERKFKKMGWIMVDVEGAELYVLQTVDFTQVCARFVSYEGEKAAVKALMEDAGYVEDPNQLGADILMVPGPKVNCGGD
jgi:FkbM family methyltransferase